MNLRLPELRAARLVGPLPGPMVGSRFEPTFRYGRRYDDPPADARQAAVLVLLYPHADHWHVPLTLRPAHLPDHEGQFYLVPHFQWKERHIWGATCIILGEFVTVVESLGLTADEV
jgi:hypothetical protein